MGIVNTGETGNRHVHSAQHVQSLGQPSTANQEQQPTLGMVVLVGHVEIASYVI